MLVKELVLFVAVIDLCFAWKCWTVLHYNNITWVSWQLKCLYKNTFVNVCISIPLSRYPWALFFLLLTYVWLPQLLLHILCLRPGLWLWPPWNIYHVWHWLMDRWVMIITNGWILWIVLAQTASLSAQRVTMMEKILIMTNMILLSCKIASLLWGISYWCFFLSPEV